MAAKAFIEQYMECMDSLPVEVQRRVSELREIEYRVQSLLEETRIVREQCDSLVNSGGGSTVEQRKWFAKLQAVMLALRDVGNEELEVTSQILDTVEDYHQQLVLSEKEMDNCRTRDELTGTRSSAAPLHGHKSAVTPPSIEAMEKKKADKGHKRAKTVAHDKVQMQGMEEDGTVVAPGNREAVSKPKEAVAGGGNSTNSTPLKPPKKKVKVKKSSRQSSRESLAPILPIPQPDFSTEPIDPDEPTYCLCQQVSFGEMIGCDNEDCAIEWFHFQCVGLTSKPKGKWYCPQCSTERNRHRTGKS